MKCKLTAVILLLITSSFTSIAANKTVSKSAKKPEVKTKTTEEKTKVAEKKKEQPSPKPKKEVDTGPKVRKFEFFGIKRTPHDQLKKISAKYIASPLYGAWTEKMIQDIQQIPIVREAHLIRDMTGNITFEIIEREPIAYLYLDKYYWMDERAKVIQPMISNQLENKIFFSGPWKNQPDYERKGGSDVISRGIAFYSMLLSKDFPENKISGIHFDANLGWIMYRVGSRAPVIFGTANLSEKVDRFVEVVPQITPMETVISRIDADFNDRIVVKLQDQEVKGSLEKFPKSSR
jgi:hypothetical protein